MTEVYLFGAAILDAVARPVSPRVFELGSVPAETRLTVGGDALNEATVLARLGHGAALRTTLGRDPAARLIYDHAAREGFLLDAVEKADAATGVNLVLVDEGGERRFLTNPTSTLRRLSLEDVLPALSTEAFRQASVATLASLFVSPELGIEEMATLLRECRRAGKRACADATRAKNGETARTLRPVLEQLDWFFPNLSEAALLTGRTEPRDIAKALLDEGVGSVAMKLGAKGCLVASNGAMFQIPAFPNARVVDTTGAGDTFSAAFQAALLEGRTAVECAAFANAAASLCVEATGATEAPLHREEIDARARAILCGK